MVSEIIVLISCAAGSTINRVCGFGFAIICMMIMPYFTGPIYAAGIVNIISILQASYLIFIYRKNINFKAFIWPLAAYFVTNFLVLRFIGTVGNAVLIRLLGCVLLGFSVYFFIIADRLKIKGNPKNGLIAGALGGALNGSFSVGGPPVAVYFSTSLDNREMYLATIQSYFFISNSYSLVIRITDGLMNMDIVRLTVFGVIGMVIGTLIGTIIFKRISEQTLRRVIYVLLAVSGLTMLIRG